MKKRIFDIIQIGSKDDFVSALCDYIIVISIALNLMVLYVSTFDLSAQVQSILGKIEFCTVIIFIIE